MHLDLTDEEAATLIKELQDIVERDRYPLSPRLRNLRAIVVKLRPEPVRGRLSFAQASIPKGSTEPLPSRKGLCATALRGRPRRGR
jgi:hypothetical protein